MKRLMEIENVIQTLRDNKKALDLLDPIKITVDKFEGWGTIMVHCYYGDSSVREWFQENKEKVKVEKFGENEYLKASVDIGAMHIFALLSESDCKEFGGVKNE